MNEALPNKCRIVFIDIVSFSKKSSHNQRILIQELTKLVEETPQISSLPAENIVQLPTGDGIALAIWSDPKVPFLASIEIQRRIRCYNKSCSSDLIIEVRTGINTGEILTVLDINKQRNIVGDGINNAQRVMDFGDTGYILVSKSIADELLDVSPDLAPLLHDSGLFADKHNLKHHVFNVFNWDIGNPATPIRNRIIPKDEPIEHHFWKTLLDLAQWEVQFLRHSIMEPAHFIIALIKHEKGDMQKALIEQKLDPVKVRRGLRRQLGKGSSTSNSRLSFSQPLCEFFEAAWKNASKVHRDIIEEDFISAFFNGNNSEMNCNYLQEQQVDIERLISFFIKEESYDSVMVKLPVVDNKHFAPKLDTPSNSTTNRPNSKLNDVSHNALNNKRNVSNSNSPDLPVGCLDKTMPLSKFMPQNISVILTVENGQSQGSSFEFSEPSIFIVGRSPDANFVLDQSDSAVSRKHFIIEIVPPRCYIRDFGSMNGTFVNGEKCEQAELHNDDIVSAGATKFRVRIVSKKSISGAVCPRCGCEYEVVKASRVEAGMCLTCIAELNAVKDIAQRSLKKSAQACCKQCGVDVSCYANKDRKAEKLKDVATYLCHDCFNIRSKISKYSKVGQYHLIEQLGQGGMGTVFLARHSETCRMGALKQIKLPEPDNMISRRFIREIRLMNDFTHSNIVRLFDDGIYESAPYFVSELLEGGSLDRHLNKNSGKISISQALHITKNILSGLDVFHQSGNVHRDIKPSNILLSACNDSNLFEAKIADLGLAKSFIETGGTNLTRANEFAGSLHYTPPEQIINFSRVDPTADIYSTGVTLYQMLTGLLPYNFGSNNGMKSMKDSLLIVLDEPIITIRERCPSFSPELASIIDKATAKQPALRYQSADSFIKDIQRFLA